MTNETTDLKNERTETVHEPIKEVIVSNEKLSVEMFPSQNSTRYNFTYSQNAYLNNSLRFADTKAGR